MKHAAANVVFWVISFIICSGCNDRVELFIGGPYVENAHLVEDWGALRQSYLWAEHVVMASTGGVKPQWERNLLTIHEPPHFPCGDVDAVGCAWGIGWHAVVCSDQLHRILAQELAFQHGIKGDDFLTLMSNSNPYWGGRVCGDDE